MDVRWKKGRIEGMEQGAKKLMKEGRSKEMKEGENEGKKKEDHHHITKEKKLANMISFFRTIEVLTHSRFFFSCLEGYLLYMLYVPHTCISLPSGFIYFLCCA